MFISFFSFSSLFLSLFIIFYSPEFSWELFLYLLKTRERRCLKDIAPGPNILLSFTSFKEGPGEYWWTHFHTSQSWFLSLIFISYFLSSGKVMRVHESYFYKHYFHPRPIGKKRRKQESLVGRGHAYINFLHHCWPVSLQFILVPTVDW